MASSRGNSSGTTTMTTTGFLTTGSDDGDFTRLKDQRKRRMESNRKSARRSRMRKQLHLDEMDSTVMRLTSENARLATGITIVSRQLAAVEAENSVLRAQLVELSHLLDSLDGILRWVVQGPDWFRNHRDWNSTCLNQPITASHDMFQY